jgi:ADP-dependent NAD(P)H-hydrate dehydratase / NAD(P)H-hydrate epimerase
MKIFTSAQIHELDKYTIENEPILSIDLMERSSKALTHAIIDTWNNRTPIVVFAGPGNNGGDALAVARLLAEQGYKVEVYLFNINGHLSEECTINRDRILNNKKIFGFTEVKQEFDPPKLENETLVVDGLFGSGLNKPVTGGFASLVKYINASPAEIVSIDIPSGLMTEDNTYNVRTNIIRADMTLTLQQLKLSFLFAENQQYLGNIKVLDIRLSQEWIKNADTKFYMIEENDIRARILPRDDFAHKGMMGNALVIAGSYGMAGAAVLASKACLRSGAGKVTVHTPKRNISIMQITVPEAVIQFDKDETYFSEAIDCEDFDAMAIGPGLGQAENTGVALIAQLRRTQAPTVVDADAINILANHRAWLQQLPKDIILTPHPKEFERLAGHCTDSYERIVKARDLAEHLQAYIIIKGHHSTLCMPDGRIFFNSTGNSGMATAGSGDVLTGIIVGLLARGYKQGDACMVGMYLHGLAGDLAAKELGKESLIASDIINYLPQAFKMIND